MSAATAEAIEEPQAAPRVVTAADLSAALMMHILRAAKNDSPWVVGIGLLETVGEEFPDVPNGELVQALRGLRDNGSVLHERRSDNRDWFRAAPRWAVSRRQEQGEREKVDALIRRVEQIIRRPMPAHVKARMAGHRQQWLNSEAIQAVPIEERDRLREAAFSELRARGKGRSALAVDIEAARLWRLESGGIAKVQDAGTKEAESVR